MREALADVADVARRRRLIVLFHVDGIPIALVLKVIAITITKAITMIVVVVVAAVVLATRRPRPQAQAQRFQRLDIVISTVLVQSPALLNMESISCVLVAPSVSVSWLEVVGVQSHSSGASRREDVGKVERLTAHAT